MTRSTESSVQNLLKMCRVCRLESISSLYVSAFSPLHLFHSVSSFAQCFYVILTLLFQIHTAHCELNTKSLGILAYINKNHMRTWNIDRNLKHTSQQNRIECIPSKEKRKNGNPCIAAYIQKTVCWFWDAQESGREANPRQCWESMKKSLSLKVMIFILLVSLFFHANPKKNNTKFEVDPRLTQRPKSFHCAHKQYVNLNCRFVEKGEPAGSSYINNTLISAMCATDHFSWELKKKRWRWKIPKQYLIEMLNDLYICLLNCQHLELKIFSLKNTSDEHILTKNKNHIKKTPSSSEEKQKEAKNTYHIIHYQHIIAAVVND